MKSTRKAYGEALAELGDIDKNIVVLDADLSKVTHTSLFKDKFPDRHINVGISEQDLVGTACGIALSGKKVFASTMAIFMAGRAYDQIRTSVAYSNIPVKLCATHAGLCTGEDGATHQMLEDISLMRSIPNMVVLSPADETATKSIIQNILNDSRPTYVRLGRNDVPKIYETGEDFKIGDAKVFGAGKIATIFATGYTVSLALEAMKELGEKGLDIRVVDLYSIKPLPIDVILKCAKETDYIISIEDHSVIGGIGSAIAEYLSKTYPKKIVMIGVEDTFGRSGTIDELMKYYRITKERIIEEVMSKSKGE